MESKLGYKIDNSNYPNDTTKRFYSSLRLVPESIYERTVEEIDAYTSNIPRAHSGGMAAVPAIGDVATIAHGDDIIRLTHRSHIVYGFAADIKYSFGVNLPFLLTKDEAVKILSVARLRRSSVPSISPVSLFFNKLPRELRDRVYQFVLPRTHWSMDEEVGRVTDLDLLGALGDLSGFYFPFGAESGILTVNQQMREEALPLAYRTTSFELEDIDELIKLLLAIGQIGRENIVSLAFGWQSNSENDFTWDEAPGKIRREDMDRFKGSFQGTEVEQPFLTLPVIHVETCLQLLKQCRRLTNLRLNFEREPIDIIDPDAFKANVGIRGLSSLRGFKKVDIQSFDHECLDHEEGVVRWLKEQLESPVP
ncbi:MAG: hypothetical protein Q9199_000269 [Rusavskia elegans]